MAKVVMPQLEVGEVLKAVPHLVKSPTRKMSCDYDEEADVLFSFERPQNATDSEMLESGVLPRYRGKKLVGMTILEASKR